tara:strand:- start:1302 stop:1853 length:552 start_codon:yes stop_codon:yes gene_type:complete
MSGWLYLIRNKDLYKIGITKNFKSRMRQLKPDNIVAKLYCTNFKELEKELHKRYKDFRIPQTEYFRLNDYHLKEINQRISSIDYSIFITLEIFAKSLLFIIVISLVIFLFFSLNINDINIIIYKSLLWMERFSIGYSFLSTFVHSGKYLSFLSELKYRFSRLTIFILFSFFFRIASICLQQIN